MDHDIIELITHDHQLQAISLTSITYFLADVHNINRE